jgi:Ala-tRNA(Pro) deacylase
MPANVCAELQRRLRDAGISFQLLTHAPVYTSEQAAQVRGTPLSSGAKALVCKLGDTFALFVIPADRKLDGKRVQRELGCKTLRFASRDELLAQTGLTPGAVPPFGSLFGLPTYVDPTLGENTHINFNAGDHAVSMTMAFADYLAFEKPRLITATQEPGLAHQAPTSQQVAEAGQASGHRPSGA